MAFWQNTWSWLGGSQRNAGKQQAGPTTYAAPSAVPVTEGCALQISAVWACVRLLSEAVASLPVTVYKKDPKGRQIDPDHWFAKRIEKPNRYQTRLEFFETMM